MKSRDHVLTIYMFPLSSFFAFSPTFLKRKNFLQNGIQSQLAEELCRDQSHTHKTITTSPVCPTSNVLVTPHKKFLFINYVLIIYNVSSAVPGIKGKTE